MPLDGISTHLLAHELNENLQDARIDKIYQPSRFDIFFIVRNKNGNIKLLLSCDPQSPRVQLTDYMRENPQMPPNFCMLLRKHLQGSRIISVTCPHYERIIEISISVTDELHDTSTRKLVIEMMGRYSNIIFLNSENRIIDALVHVDSSTSRVREIMPARIYEAPPVQGKISPDDALAMVEKGELPILPDSMHRPLAKALLDSLLGFSPLLANDICFQSKNDPRCSLSSLSEDQTNSLLSVCRDILSSICTLHSHPAVFYIDGEPKDWHALSLQDAGIRKDAGTISEAMDIVQHFSDQRANFEAKRRSIRAILNNAFNHASKKLSIHEADLRETENAEKLKLEGELVLAYQYLIRPDDTVLTIPDYPDFGQSTTLSLEPGMTPSEQGQLYLKRYRKEISRRESALRFIETEKDEVSYLDSLLKAVDAASEPDDLSAIDYEIKTSLTSDKDNASRRSDQKQVYHPGKSKSGKVSSRNLRQAAKAAQSKKNKMNNAKKAEDPSLPRKFTVDGGLEVLSGRNNIQNDNLTFHVASKDDLWFHAKNIPGTHVILRAYGKAPSDKAITEAASIAAYYSRSNKPFANEMSESKTEYDVRVEIDYCPVSHVRKIPKAKPGMVIYEEYNTLLVSAKLPRNQEKTQ